MNIKNNILFLILVMTIFNNCSRDHFIVYRMSGEEVIKHNRSRGYKVSDITLYFGREDIEKNYKEINIIATNNFYYGQFFFDEVFMDILKRKAQSIRADAIIFERDKKDFPNYNKDYLYFTAIQYKD